MVVGVGGGMGGGGGGGGGRGGRNAPNEQTKYMYNILTNQLNTNACQSILGLIQKASLRLLLGEGESCSA